MSLLVDRLAKEGSTVSIIAPADFDISCKPALQYNIYNDSYTDEGMDRLVRSVSPDTVFFAGGIYQPGMNASYNARGKYIASLLNMLDHAKDSRVSKFIYMSSDEVYDRKAPRPAGEQAPVSPENQMGILCGQGESLCAKYAEVFKIRTVIMRFAPIFGFFSTADLLKTLPVYTGYLSGQEGKRSYVYIKDAAEAAVRVILSGDASVYNVGGNEPASGSSQARRLTNGTALADAAEADLSIDSSLIKKELEWYIRYDLDSGLKEMKGQIAQEQSKEPRREKHTKNKKEKTGRLRDSKVVWTLETILMFVIAAILMTLVKDDYMFSKINFLVIYILIVSLLHGMRQSILAIVLSCAFFIYQATPEGMTTLGAILNVSNILIIAQMVLIGVMAGYTVDRHRTAVTSREMDYDYLSKEFSELNLINEENTFIKHEYERRLVDYKESLPTLYTIISKLNSTEKEEIYPAAVRTVQDALHASGVGIYITNRFSYIRLVASDGNPGFAGKSVSLSGYPDIREKIGRHEIYINNNMKQGVPQMAAPIVYKGNVIALVTVNDVPFEMLSLHQVNMIRTVSAIITIFIVRAGEVEELKKEEKYYEGTNILKTQAFRELLRERAQASNDRLSNYAVLKVNGTYDLSEISLKLTSCIRENDYIGEMEDGTIALILTNSTDEEAVIVEKRIREMGIECTITRKESL
jgi:nucleoside-diphosphate-sugar epimerase